MLCVFCHNKKIGEKFFKKYTHTHQFSHTSAILLNAAKQESEKENNSVCHTIQLGICPVSVCSDSVYVQTHLA